MAFSNVLKELRSRDGLTQLEVGQRLGITKSAVSMYEQGVREPNFETMEAIADLFAVPMDRLYGRNKETLPTVQGEELSQLQQKFIETIKTWDDETLRGVLRMIDVFLEERGK